MNRCPNCGRVEFLFYTVGDEIWYGSGDCRREHRGQTWDIFGAKVKEDCLLCICCGKTTKTSEFKLKGEKE